MRSPACLQLLRKAALSVRRWGEGVASGAYGPAGASDVLPAAELLLAQLRERGLAAMR